LGKSQGQPTNLNAKKLDIDFDCDDFFNQFDPTAIKKETKPVEIVKAPVQENKP
jgi:hypothetical protein